MAEATISQRWTGKTARLVDQFNELMPVGSPVVFWPGVRGKDAGRKSRTRSTAWLLGGHTPVVMVEGYPGAIALSHVMGYAPTEEPK